MPKYLQTKEEDEDENNIWSPDMDDEYTDTESEISEAGMNQFERINAVL